MTIDFGAQPAKAAPAKGGPWVWVGDEWVPVSTDTGDGVPATLDLDGDDLRAADDATLTRVALRVGNRLVLARVAMRNGGFDPNQKRAADGKWTDGPPGMGGKGKSPVGSDDSLLKDKPWTTQDRGVGAAGTIYTDEAELAAFKLLDGYKRIEPDVTKNLKNISSRAGGRMEGLDFKLKGQESLARKIEQKSATKGLTMQAYAAKIGDALRYTMLLKDDSYGKDTQAAIDSFRDQGYEVEVENTWTPGSSYKGINTNMKRNGQTFEVQFHTQESFDVKMDQHVLYERARDTTLPPEERAKATAQMEANAAAMKDPNGAGDVS